MSLRQIDWASIRENLCSLRTDGRTFQGWFSKSLLKAGTRIFFVWQENRMRPIFIGRSEVFAVQTEKRPFLPKWVLRTARKMLISMR